MEGPSPKPNRTPHVQLMSKMSRAREQVETLQLSSGMWLWLKKPVPEWNPSCLILSHAHVSKQKQNKKNKQTKQRMPPPLPVLGGFPELPVARYSKPLSPPPPRLTGQDQVAVPGSSRAIGPLGHQGAALDHRNRGNDSTMFNKSRDK